MSVCQDLNPNISKTNSDFFKIPTAYVQVGPRLGHTPLGFENLLPVSSGKFKMAAKNKFFANKLGIN